MRAKAPAKKEMTKAEAVSYIVMGAVAYFALTIGMIFLGAIVLMFFWGYIAPVFGLPLLNISAAASIMALLTILKLWMK